MAALDEVDKIWPRLTGPEKAQVLQWAARDLGQSFPGIESTPGVSGGEPCIVRTRIPVWILVEGRRQGLNDGELLRAYPTLRAEDLVNAWSFARAHADEIEAQITENEAA